MSGLGVNKTSSSQTSLHPRISQDPWRSHHTSLHSQTSWDPSGVPSHIVTSPDLLGSKWGPITHRYIPGPPGIPVGSHHTSLHPWTSRDPSGVPSHIVISPDLQGSQWGPITHHYIPGPPRIPVGSHYTSLQPQAPGSQWDPIGSSVCNTTLLLGSRI